jgi:hypothetical protein
LIDNQVANIWPAQAIKHTSQHWLSRLIITAMFIILIIHFHHQALAATAIYFTSALHLLAPTNDKHDIAHHSTT